ncbi:SRPBCC family protein [Paraburkholderia sp.]|jgi:uncharacterized protein YndB with AHSA1/START domain|uniref:SRPBCC family protein n=2 Tax=Burkholderiales TaxID=80840 RepID=UPI00397AC17B
MMSKPEYVYVTYINAPVDKVSDALTDPEMTKDYWGRARNVSDWQPGSRWEHQHYDDASDIAVAGTVLECDPPHKLAVTWAKPGGGSESRVTYLLEEVFGVTRLTVTHDQLDDEQAVKRIAQGWPAILSSLKSLLETGHALQMTRQRWTR